MNGADDFHLPIFLQDTDMHQQFDAASTAALLPFPMLVRALRLAVAQLHDGKLQCPERQVMPMPGGAYLMSMVATAADIAVHKLISVVPGNRERHMPTILGQVSVLDVATGEVSMTLDGATVTGSRTAALSMLGIETLLGHAPERVLLVGTGIQAAFHARALGALFPHAQVDVAGRAKVEQFCEGMQPQCQRIAPAAGGLAHVHPGTEVVLTCTSSPSPVYLHPAQAGRLLIAVGAFKSHTAEIAAHTVRASHLVVDEPGGARHEAGDLILAGVDWDSVRPLAAMLEHQACAAREPVLFKTVGCAAWDLAAARVAGECRAAKTT